MGMSSSQARLLTLTARMHDIEHRAQKIEADKLRLANDSRKAYEEYLIALDSKKIQYKSIASDGSITFRDATMNIMQNGCIPNYEGEHALKNLFLQNQEGKIMVTPSVAREFWLDSWAATKSMDDYIEGITGKHKSTREVASGSHLEPTDEILSFTKIANSIIRNPNLSVTYNPIPNTTGLDDVIYDNFQNEITTVDTSGMVDIATVSTLSAGTNYVINDIAGLQNLSTLYAVTSGVTVYMSSNLVASGLNMSGVNWDGIRDFAGTFEGNGVVIKNLGQGGATATNGIFKSILSSAKVKNIGVADANIDTTVHENGGIVGHNIGGHIENCFFTGTINTIGSWSGGIVGLNLGTIKDCSAKIDMTTNYCCDGGIAGHNGEAGYIGVLDHCYVTGSLTNTSGTTSMSDYNGGLVGHNMDTTVIKDCVTTVKMRDASGNFCGGVVIGDGNIDSTHLTIEDVIYDPSINPSGTITSHGDFGTTDIFKTPVTTPCIYPSTMEGGFYANIVGALLKNNGENPDSINEADIKAYISALMSSSGGDFAIANINEYLYKYISGADTTGGAFVTALQNDINSHAISNTTASAYQNVFDSSKNTISIPTTGDTWDPLSGIERGLVKIPTATNIADMLYYSFKKTGKTVDQTAVRNWVNSKYNTSTTEGKSKLADLNDAIQAGDIEAIYTKFTADDIFEKATPSYPPEKWDVDFLEEQTIDVTYKQKSVTDYTTESYWDTTDPDIAQAMVWWLVAQRGVIVVTEEQASNYKYLNNIMEVGEAVLTTFKPEAVSSLSGMSESDIRSMSDEQYNELMGIINTNVAVELTVHEVADEKGLKKAEADYEAKLRLIDRKDRNYDTKLAAVESERNAIKQEMETLKTVIHDNGERTFKLFS